MKYLPMLLVLLLAGCSSGTTKFATELGDVETMSTDTGRFTAWTKVEVAKVKAVQAVETSNATAPAQANVTVVLDTEAKILAWTHYQTTAALKDAVVEMAKALRPRSKALDPTPMPKGAFAEGVDSVTGLAVGVGNAPATVAGVVGHFLKGTAKDTGESAGPKVTAAEGATVTVNQAAGTSSAIDSSNKPITTTTTTAAP